MKQRSAQFLRKRKFYMMLPLLVLPFVTLAFWAMGGGKGNAAEVKTAEGLNLQLPDAKLKDEKNFDKLSFYNLAEKDSLQHAEALQNDPNYKDTGLNVLHLIHAPENNNLITTPFSNTAIDASEQKIYKKINELNQQINTPPQNKIAENTNGSFSKQLDKLQGMMQTMNDKKDSDPEMEQIGGMLDKILDIQHPDRVKAEEKSKMNKQQVFPMQLSLHNDYTSCLDTIEKKAANKFYDLNNTSANEPRDDHAIEAVIHQTQTVVQGSVIKFRLTGDVCINDILIPKGTFIYGTAEPGTERLLVTINSIRYQNNLLPVSLTVYDLDGIGGIHIPGTISRDVAKQSAEQSLQTIKLDPSVAAAAASTGIEAAKSLLVKKAKLVKVTLKAGYKILLCNKQ